MQGSNLDEPIGQQFHGRPSLEYQYAFDLCAVEVHRAGDAAQVIAASPFYARELLKHFANRENALLPSWDPHLSSVELAGQLGEETAYPGLLSTLPSSGQARTFVWAEPELEGGEELASRICKALPVEGRLYVIASSHLAHFLPEWQRSADQPAAGPAGMWQTRRWLQQAGLTIQAIHGFHGPVSIIWGYASGIMARLHQPDLVDRYHFRMRASYATGHWQALLAPVCVVVASWPYRGNKGRNGH